MGLEVATDAENSAPTEDRQSFDLNMDFKSGDQVVVHVDFPTDKAILAVTALKEIGTDDYVTRMLSAFRNDPSVSAKLKEQGLTFDEPESSED